MINTMKAQVLLNTKSKMFTRRPVYATVILLIFIILYYNISFQKINLMKDFEIIAKLTV